MKVDFIYNFRRVKGEPFLMIEDLDRGGRSLTNGIHEVVEIICKEHRSSPTDFHIIYRDSDGVWDGYVYSTFQFIPLRQHHWLKAATKYINEQYGSD